MEKKAKVEAYFNAWIIRDADAILATLASNGTYEDPSTGRPISGEALRGYVTGLWSIFPDLTFETVSHSDDGTSAQWIMRGTNRGSFNGLPPTGLPVELRGADFFTFDDAGQISSVTGYFDAGVIPRQLGLDIVVQPSQIGPFRFGTSTMVQTGKTQEPGAFSITYLEARDDDCKQAVREGSRATLIEMLEMDGFIGATTATIGNRMVTISAWEDADSPRQLMRTGTHSEIQKRMYDGTLAQHGFTSVWVKERVNPYMIRCDVCGKMTRNPDDERKCRCGGQLPAPAPYW